MRISQFHGFISTATGGEASSSGPIVPCLYRRASRDETPAMSTNLVVAKVSYQRRFRRVGWLDRCHELAGCRSCC